VKHLPIQTKARKHAGKLVDIGPGRLASDRTMIRLRRCHWGVSGSTTSQVWRNTIATVGISGNEDLLLDFECRLRVTGHQLWRHWLHG
jgi:hypothetical protein